MIALISPEILPLTHIIGKVGPTLGSGHDQIDPLAAAHAAYKSRVPIWDRDLGHEALSHLGRIGLNPSPAIEAPFT
jgi:hypothetical protein